MSGTREGRALLALLLIVVGLVGMGGGRTPAAIAHALLLESTPKHDATSGAPAQLVLRFNGRIEKRLSRVLLVGGPDRASIPLDGPDDSSPDTLAYRLPTLAPGPWEVRWRVLSVDGHFTEGRLRFTITNP